MQEILLTKGFTTQVDDEDHAWLMQWKWYAQVIPLKNVTKVYAVRNEGSRKVYMHRALLKAGDAQDVDHANNNGLDNRRENLRLCDRAQNQVNSHARIGASGYRGVCYLSPVKYPAHAKKPYKAKIQYQGKAVHVGFFETGEAAARAWDAKAAELYGEFAKLNFPNRAA